ncbi:MAG: hypothetical protein K2W82_16185 [Candidatus Obscuribacterales bacterium]|nr:hypothetical protein [Candidatus Obscuribacterales bacterium]
MRAILAACFLSLCFLSTTAYADKIVIQDGVDFTGVVTYKDDGVTQISYRVSRKDKEENTYYRPDGKTVHWKSSKNTLTWRKEFEFFDSAGTKVQRWVLHFKVLGEVGSGEVSSLVEQWKEITFADASGNDSYTQFWRYDKNAQGQLGWHLKRVEQVVKGGSRLNGNKRTYEKDPADSNRVLVSMAFTSRSVAAADLSAEEKQMFKEDTTYQSYITK